MCSEEERRLGMKGKKQGEGQISDDLEREKKEMKKNYQERW